MSASVDAITALKAKFPQVADRASRDCPAVDVPTADRFCHAEVAA